MLSSPDTFFRTWGVTVTTFGHADMTDSGRMVLSSTIKRSTCNVSDMLVQAVVVCASVHINGSAFCTRASRT